jgi:phage-related protein
MSSIISGLNIKNIFEYDSNNSYSKYSIVDYKLVTGISVYPSYTGFGMTGLTSWFNNDDLKSFNVDTEFNVTGWLNLVPLSGNLTQISSNENLRPFVNFNEYYLDLTGAQLLSGTGFASSSRTFITIVEVADRASPDHKQKIFHFCNASGDANGIFQISGANTNGSAKVILDNQQFDAVCSLYDTKNIFTIVQNPSTSSIKVRQNGYEIGTYGSYNSNWSANSLILGNNTGTTGLKYYELIHFTGVLSETEIDYYEKYLYEKYFDSNRLYFAKQNVPVGEAYAPLTYTGNLYWTQDIDELFKISYGSNASFSSNLSSLEMGDGYRSNVAKNINTLQTRFQINYNGLTDEQAKCLLAYFENCPETENKSLYEGFKGIEMDLFNPYKNNAELYFKTASHKTVYNNINDITVEAESLYDSSLDYKGMLVQLDEINIRTYTDEVYELAYNDVFYYPNNAYNKRGYYYYTGSGFSQSNSGVTGPLTIPPQNSPTGNQSWFTNKFYFKGDINYDINSSLRLAVNDLKNSTIEYEKDGINYNMLEFNVAFEKRSNAETRALLKFLDDRAGFKIFEYVLPQPYNKTINVFCPEWNHTYNFLNNNNISIKLIETKAPSVATSVFNTIISWSS